MGHHLRTRLPLLLTLLTGAIPLRAMTPPSLSVNVMPRSPVSGLAGLSDERWGLGFATWSSARAHRRAGTRGADNPLHEKTDSFRTTLIADLPLTRRWTAVAALPYVRTRSSYDGGGDAAAGPGDALLLGKYTLFQNPAGPILREVQLLAGLELPTGKTDVKDRFGDNLPASQQPGSKTMDWLAGAAGAVNLKRVSLYGDATYKLSGARAYTFGDFFAVNGGVNFPFGPRARFSATAELNLEAAGRDTSDKTGPGVYADKTVRDSGHEALYATPGLQWRPSRRWSLSAAVQLPLYQNFRGVQLAAEANWIFSLQGRWGRHEG